jgi:hypothetical protein
MKKNVFAALLLAIAGIASANATTITFDALEQSGTGAQVMSTYTESGFLLTAQNDFGSAFQGNTDFYAGSAGLLNNRGNELTTLTKVGGGTFSLNGISLAEASTIYGPGAIVTFIGNIHGGGTVSESFTVGNALAFTAYTFTGFSNLDSVTWLQTAPYSQFDNIVLDANAVPEPASLALIGLGIAGLVASRRKAAAKHA